MKKKILSMFLAVTLVVTGIVPFDVPIAYAAGVVGAANTYVTKPGQLNTGGITSATLDNPGYSISLAYKEELVDPILETDSGAVLDKKIVDTYNSHIPRALSSFFYFPSSSYRSSGEMGLAYYTPSNGEIVYAATTTEDISAKYRIIGASASAPRLVADELFDYLDSIGKLKDFSALGKGKWKEYVTSANGATAANADNIWKYFLASPSSYNARVSAYLDNDDGYTSESADNKKALKYLNYADLLISLYVMASPNHKGVYEAAIESYFNESGDQLTHPDLIVVEPAVTFVQSGAYYTMRAGDAANAMFGATPKNNLYTARTGDYTVASNFTALNGASSSPYTGIRKLIQDVARAAVAELPSRPRPTDLQYIDGGTADPAKQDALSWARSPILGGWFRTDTSLATRGTYSSFSRAPVFSILDFAGVLEGFSIIYPKGYMQSSGGKGDHTLVINPRDTVVIPTTQPKIGTPVRVNVQLNQSEQDRTALTNLLDTTTFAAGFPKIKVTVTRKVSGVADQVADTSLKPGANAGSGFTSGGENVTFGNIKGDGVATTITVSNLKALLSNPTGLVFNDAISGVDIANSSNITYEYSSTVELQISTTGIIYMPAVVDFMVAETAEVKTASVTFTRGATPPPDNTIITWASPSANLPINTYSELKSNAVLSEQFEAMAGIPTGEKMYVTLGGTSYVIDLELKYHEDETTTRQYESNYTSTNSEYYTSDRGGPWTVGGYSVPYTGGSWTKTWTGSIPNKATAKTFSGTGTVSGSVPAIPDLTAYNAALAEATAYASTVNGTVISHTAASDGVNRTFNSWGASVSPSQSLPQTTSDSQTFSHTETVLSGDPPVSSTITVYDPGSVTVQPGGAGSYSISVSFSMPAYRVSGFGADRVLPAIQDRWVQTVTYDYMEITKARVWKLDQGTLSGGDLNTVFGVTEVPITVTKGDPSIFYNIAGANNSANNRLRYTLETNQHDKVVWNNGARTNKENGTGGTKPNPYVSLPGQTSKFSGDTYTNSTYGNIENSHVTGSTALDRSTPEWLKFDQQRKMLNTVTVISDFLVIQTDEGDLPILYFEDKVNETKQSQQNFSDVKATIDDIWLNNVNSVSQEAYYGGVTEMSYLGNYWSPSSKYSVKRTSDYLTSIFDTLPAGKTRPSRPSTSTVLSNTTQLTTRLIQNGEYGGWSTEAFYKFIPLTSTTGVNKSTSGLLPFSTTIVAKYGSPGFTLNAPYSDNHDSTNDIVIHSPVSAEYAGVVSLPASLDQRTTASKLTGGNLQQPISEWIKQLKDPHPKQEFIFNGDAELLNEGKIVNWLVETTDGTKTTATYRTADTWKINGTYSFELRKTADYNGKISYYTETAAVPNENFTFVGKIGVHRAQGYFQIDALDATGALLQTWKSTAQTSSTVATKTVSILTPANTAKFKVSMVLEHDGVVTSTMDYLFADDLSLTLNNGTTAEWVANSYTNTVVTQLPNPDYVTPYTIPNPYYITPYTIANPEYIPAQTIPNPAYVAPVPGATTTYNYTGSVQSYTAPVTGTYRIEAAGGHGAASRGTLGESGGNGGVIIANVNLTAGQTYYYVVGNGTTSYSQTGYIYPGAGRGQSDQGSDGDDDTGGGGGYTGMFTGATASQANALIVAGGGAGGGASVVGGPGGRIDTTNIYSALLGSSAASETNPDGGGGGGYYGGARNYGGTSYTSGTLVSYTIGGNSSAQGYLKITTPTIAGSGTPTITVPAVGQPTIDVNNGAYIPAVTEFTSQTYQGSWSSAVAKLNNKFGINTYIKTMTGLPANPSWGGGYVASDVMYTENAVYIAHMNFNYVSKYSLNADGTIGTKLQTTNWYASDSYITYINTNASSVPYAFAMYSKDGTDYLIGWSGSHSSLFRWTIVNNVPTNMVTINHSYGSITNYSRGGWDGKDNVYFFNRGNNYLYKYNILTQSMTQVRALSNGNSYMSLSWTGSGLLVDEDLDMVFGTSGSNLSSGLLSAWSLSTGNYLGTITGGSTSLTGFGNNTGSLLLNPVHRGIATLIRNYDNVLYQYTTSYSTPVDTLMGGSGGTLNVITPAQGVPWLTPAPEPTITVNNANYVPAVVNVGSGSPQTFNYTGSVQSYVVPVTGTYQLEVWGASGGRNTTNGSSVAGLGGYSKGSINLAQGQTIYIYVGGKGADTPYSADSSPGTNIAGGWNGGGNGTNGGAGGGGATDIRIGGTSLTYRKIVAGGAGGVGYNSGVHSGGYGGGTSGGAGTGSGTGSPGTQVSGYALGQGGAWNSTNDCGGGGGGYYGGYGGSTSNTSGGGGSGYIGGVTGGVMSIGVWSGHGKAVITPPAVNNVTPAVSEPWIEGLQPFINVTQEATIGITEAPEEWYEYIEKVIPPDNPITSPSGTFTPGNFILIDNEFEVYFPNLGDFYGDGSLGVGTLRTTEGRGFTDAMDTTKWTKAKWASFQFPVIYNGQMYLQGEDVPLDINDADGYYQFYVPLAASEGISTEVTFKVEATNSSGFDNSLPSNYTRYSNYAAKHSAERKYNVDVVGRIGNLTMVDTGDFRFSNFFKNPLLPTQWFLQNVVKKVDMNSQRGYIGDQIDIRGDSLIAGKYLNTYGTVAPYGATAPVRFPLNPLNNNINSLQSQPLRVGYKTYQDISTIGNYHNGAVQIIPYYYSVNLNTGVIKQVDVYTASGDGNYLPINLFNNAVPGWDPNSVETYSTPLNWDDESGRRNYSTTERTITESVASAFKVPDADGNFVDMLYPMGKYYSYGTAQLIQMTARNRTFIGSTATLGQNTNPGSRIPTSDYQMKAQRWHFSMGLPSSTVFVEDGLQPTTTNIEATQNSYTIIVMALDIVSVGEVYNLRYDGTLNGSVTVAGRTVSIASIPYPVISIISSSKRSSDDVTTGGTH